MLSYCVKAEAEVERLDQLKASKMTEIAFKKQTELEVIYARTHIEIDSVGARDKILALVDSGTVEPSELLAEIDNQILRAKESAERKSWKRLKNGSQHAKKKAGSKNTIWYC